MLKFLVDSMHLLIMDSIVIICIRLSSEIKNIQCKFQEKLLLVLDGV